VFALVPLSCIYWRRLGPALLILVATLCYFGFWLYLSQNKTRYLAPIAASATFLSIWSIWQTGQTLTQNISGGVKITHSKAVGAFLRIIPPAIAAYNALERSRYQLQHWDEILGTRPGYNLMQHANELIPRYGNRVLNAGFENAVYFYKGVAIGDWFGPGRYSQMLLAAQAVSRKICSKHVELRFPTVI